MKYDVIVVGGGAAGLTAAAYAARAGKTVALFERQEELGGLVRSVSRNGFVFDMGLRAIENAGIILPMAAELGLPLEYVKSRVSLGIGNRIIEIESRESLSDYQALLEWFYPDSKHDIAEILTVIRRIMKDMDVLYGIDNPLFKDLKRDYRFVFRVLLPWSVRFLLTIGRINRMTEPVETFLARLTANESLRSVIGQHFFRYTPAFFAMSYFSVYMDYLYPSGGTGTLMELLAGYCDREGVSLFRSCPVVGLNPGRKTIRCTDGSEHSYSGLVWAGDLNDLYESVDASEVDAPGSATAIDATGARGRGRQKTAHRRAAAIAARRDELRNHSSGDSVFSVFLSVDESPEFFSAISEGHFFYTPDPRGLGDLHTAGLDDLLSRYDALSDPIDEVKRYVRIFLALNTFEISIPVLKDPEMAPPGKTGLIVSWLFDYRLMKKIQATGWYAEFKEFGMDQVIRILSQTVYPGLEEKVLDRFCSTPISIAERTGNTGGAITGWAFGPESVPVVHKIQQVSSSVLTPIKDVFKAGQWAYSPAGLPIAILTGKLAAVRAVRSGG